MATLGDVDCLNTSRCYVTAVTTAAAAQVLVINSGVVTARPVGTGGQPLTDIDCIHVPHCVAIAGTNSYTTHDSGEMWHESPFGAAGFAAEHIGCVPNTTRCFVTNGANSVLRTSDDGHTWRALASPADQDLTAVTCPALSLCYFPALDRDGPTRFAVVKTIDNGASFTTSAVPRARPATAVACASATACVAVGRGANGTTSGIGTTDGTGWASQQPPSARSGRGIGLSCPTATHCIAVIAGLAYSTDNGGADWTTVALP